ncbi:ABC transporter permease [Mesorhizobium humile]|uniref:ABC transporter permease n=1 Tax=Mesorhizobium humile TaxID=3072313 RepID=A0ABU4YR10_9HYPH|nr:MULTISPECIES: ABC transporter permease [unclassified Mesorhizobium]MDX8463307.1 ABC transporter permease [Mesorhizobium sp. VK2D]MDX8488349.1 ABC transporter permease [Mesorhizobium sp. VK2B]
MWLARIRTGELRFAVMLAPLLLFMVLAFDVPVLTMLEWSFSNPTPTTRHYVYLVETPVYLRVIANTLRIASMTTLACIFLGYPLAYWMRGLSSGGRAACLVLVLLPFWISVLIRTYSWIVILGNDGLLNRALLATGLVHQPVQFLYNEHGVLIGMVNVLLPFFVLPLYAAFSRFDERCFQAAASLGASKRAIFWRLFVPMSGSAVTASATLVFILSLGFYITPAVLGGGNVMMIANMLDVLINTLPRWETAAALSAILMVTILLLYSINYRLRTGGRN